MIYQVFIVSMAGNSNTMSSVHGLTILIRAEKSYECVCLYVKY